MANKKEELLKALKTMAPGDVMVFVADQMGMNPVKFLTKNAGQLALKAAKAGWVKAGGIKDAMKDFSAKNAEDATGIDWNDVKVDEDAVKLTCLFDRDSGKKLKEFVKDLSDKMTEFAKEEKELDEAQRKLTEALSKDPTDHLAVSLLSCVKKLKTATGRNVAGKMWEMQVMSYMKEKGIKMSYSDMMKVASGKMTSGDDALDGMCSMFDSLKGSKSTEVIADAAELFKDKELMDAYGDKFKSAMKYAGKFQGNDVFDIAGSAAAGTVADKALSGAKNFKQMQAAFDDLDSGVKKEIEDLMKQGPQGALKAADKLGKLSGGNAGAQQVLDKMMQKQDWYENASSDMKQALDKDMYSLSLQSKDLSDVMNSGDVASAAGDDAVSGILADKAKTPKDAVAAAGGAEDAAKEMAGDEELKKETAKKAGIDAFTALGWARLAAKTTGYVLNHGKDVVDALGAKKIKNQEDKNVIAEIRVQLENAGDDQKYSDSEFSVRFTTDDFKWHATCVDDRKMKFPEDTLVKKVLDTETAKKFKEFCLKKWNGIFRPESGSDYSMLPFILQNIDKFGLKGADAAFFEKVKTVADNMDKIESAFK